MNNTKNKVESLENKGYIVDYDVKKKHYLITREDNKLQVLYVSEKLMQSSKVDDIVNKYEEMVEIFMLRDSLMKVSSNTVKDVTLNECSEGEFKINVNIK